MKGTGQPSAPPVPFSFFVSLLHEISQIPPQKTTAVCSRTNDSYPALEIFCRWIMHLRTFFSPLPPGSTAVIFRLLFPEEDACRKYDMQEMRLSQYLAECLGIDAKKLKQWQSGGSSGCLGTELKMSLENTCPNDEFTSSLSIVQVDNLLDELASNSGFSDISIRTKYPRGVRRDRLPLLKDLFRSMSPIEASFLAHIILKDLRPILYPLPETHYTIALISYNTASVRMLTKEHAMRAWDPTHSMLSAYLVRSTMNAAATCFELPPHEREPNVPCIGTPVEIPESVKGRDYRHAMNFFRGSRRVWAELKYDGERAQIHVEVLPYTKPHITIFSKSKRNSTMDRRGVHGHILDALNLSNSEGHEPKLKKNIILDAEMVACSGNDITEFWRIRKLIDRTADGIRHNYSDSDSLSSPNSCRLSVGADTYHLGLVFFDILLLDSVSLLSTPYAQRREALQSIIRPIPGKSMFAERVPIDLHFADEDRALSALEKIFQDVLNNRQEGIVLKAEEASYHDFRTPWVKLKKDYISGYGDTLDLVVVGAGWDKARARELRVTPTTLTTLYIGALAMSESLSGNTESRPHFHIYFTASYGLSREELEEINFLLQNSVHVPYGASMTRNSLPYDFTLLGNLQPPSLLLATPLLAELFGAGFTKSPQSKNYELRFPRVTKVYRSKERDWKDGLDLLALQRIARDALMSDTSEKEVRDWCNDLWGKPVSPDIKSSLVPERRATFDTRSTSNVGDGTWIHMEKSSLSGRKRKCGSGVHLLAVSQQSTLAPTSKKSRPESTEPTSYNSDFDHYVPSVSMSGPSLVPRQAMSAPLSPWVECIEHALVWFAKPSSYTSELSDWSLVNTVPRQQRLHSIESLLTGCGWHTDNPGSAWAKRGVVLVNEGDETGRAWKSYALKAIEERRAMLSAVGPFKLLSPKPIWIFDVSTLTLEKCDTQNHAFE